MLSGDNFRSNSSLTQNMRSQQGNQLVASEESLGQVGECVQCRRPYEAFCTVCHTLVCPSCVMFGAHKGHSVCTMEEAARDIRKQMDEGAKSGNQGILKLDKTENVLVDIRHTKLSCEEAKQRALKEVETTFGMIFKLIKQRKDEVVNEVNKHFDNQLTLIANQESLWQFIRSEKQERAIEVVKMAKLPNDYMLIDRAQFILTSLEMLRQNPTYHNVHIVNAIDATFNATSGLNLNEFKKSLEKWVTLGEPVLIQYKC